MWEMTLKISYLNTFAFISYARKRTGGVSPVPQQGAKRQTDRQTDRLIYYRLSVQYSNIASMDQDSTIPRCSICRAQSRITLNIWIYDAIIGWTETLNETPGCLPEHHMQIVQILEASRIPIRILQHIAIPLLFVPFGPKQMTDLPMGIKPMVICLTLTISLLAVFQVLLRSSQVSLSSNYEMDFNYSAHYTRVGLYKGRMVAVKEIRRKTMDITRKMKKELKKVRLLALGQIQSWIMDWRRSALTPFPWASGLQAD